MPELMPPITIKLAAPRGFCAGVDRAIEMVEKALDKYGAPVYVRHEIVHNETVVSRLRELGAVFVEELEEVPADRPVIFSAHGVPKAVPADAQSRGLFFLDATCPLVSKVHIETERHNRDGHHVLLIGHEGHPEVIGTMGQLPPGAMSLIEDETAAQDFVPPVVPGDGGANLAYVTQTTLSVDDTIKIVDILKQRFPNIHTPHKDDICYATTNRQDSVRAAAAGADILIVLGSQTSSNSKRLVEVGERAGCAYAVLIEDASHLDWPTLEKLAPRTVALTAGASAPESVVQGVIDAFRQRTEVTVEQVETTTEGVTFKLPRELA